MKKLLFLLLSTAVLSAVTVNLNAQLSHTWTQTANGPNNEGTLAIASDPEGNVFATGYFIMNTTLGSPDTTVTLNSEDDRDIFLVKYAASGHLLWAHSFGGSFNDDGYGLTTDSEGNVYMTGVIEDEADFDPSGGEAILTSAGLEDIIVVKYDPDGNFVWGFSIGNMFTDEGKKIVYDPAGFIYVSGGYRTTCDFDPGAGVFELTSTSFTTDIFIAKYTLDGAFVWAKSMGAAATDNLQGMAFGNGSIYISGGFDSTTDLDPSAGEATHTSAGNTDIFIASYDTAGNYQWSHSFGSSSYDISHDIATGPLGDVYITGNFWYTVDFSTTGGSLEVTSNAQSDVFIAAFNNVGDDLWAFSAGGSGAEESFAVTTNNGGQVFITGTFSDEVDFDPGLAEFILTSGGFYNVFVAGYQSGGDFFWAGSFNSPASGYGRAIHCDATSRTIAGGEYQTSADFDTDITEYIVDAISGYDAFISVYGGCFISGATISEEICAGEAYNFNGTEITVAGIYNTIYTTLEGCDSLVTLELSVILVDTSVAVTDTMLTANATTATYQWIDCADGFSPVDGATDQEFTPGITGEYAVIVTQNGCTDTSGCYVIEKEQGNSITDMNSTGFQLFPNPAVGFITVETARASSICIYNATGGIIYSGSVNGGSHTIMLEDLTPGIYYITATELQAGTTHRRQFCLF